MGSRSKLYIWIVLVCGFLNFEHMCRLINDETHNDVNENLTFFQLRNTVKILQTKVSELNDSFTSIVSQTRKIEKNAQRDIEALAIKFNSDLLKEKHRNAEKTKLLYEAVQEMNMTIVGLVAESEEETRDWLLSTNKLADKYYNELLSASWNYRTNITEHNARQRTVALVRLNAFMKRMKQEARRRVRPYYRFDTKRQLFVYQLKSAIPTNETIEKRLVELSTKLSTAYSMGRVCHRNKTKCLSLDPELNAILATSNDVDKLEWAWKGWRDATGPQTRDSFIEWVKLANLGAQDNGYRDLGEQWRLVHFELPGIEQIAERLYQEIQPMYKLLFGYVRRKLFDKYGEASGIDLRGPIPAHLLGNMWAQSWSNLINKGIAMPFPDEQSSDVTAELIRQNYTVTGMFRLAEEFFTSIGLYPMTKTFWNKSMLVKPNDRNVSCHGSAYDFHDGEDFRIKMCTEVTHNSLFVVHHEMGHIEYYIAYKELPSIYRRGANSAFHEAIGDLIALSVNTVKHMKTIGLMDDSNATPEQRHKQDINFLMKQALKIITFLPFGYLMDKYRWNVFDGTTDFANLNRKWWEMRLKYQGLVPPVKRSERDFDPGAKYHVPYRVPYLRYFISHVIQFQFYEAMCKDVHTGPLHQCDFYRSKDAGGKLRRALKMGRSRPWPDAMEVITGQREISTSAIIKYFKPLIDWLKKENGNEATEWLKSGETVESVIDRYFV